MFYVLTTYNKAEVEIIIFIVYVAVEVRELKNYRHENPDLDLFRKE